MRKLTTIYMIYLFCFRNLCNATRFKRMHQIWTWTGRLYFISIGDWVLRYLWYCSNV